VLILAAVFKCHILHPRSNRIYGLCIAINNS